MGARQQSFRRHGSTQLFTSAVLLLNLRCRDDRPTASARSGTFAGSGEQGRRILQIPEFLREEARRCRVRIGPSAEIDLSDSRQAGLVTAAMELAAIEKAGGIDSWRPYIYEKVGGGLLITGCRTRPKTRGPNKGEPHYLTREDRLRVLVTREDIWRARDRFVQAAGE